MSDATPRPPRDCNDCGVRPGEAHQEGCDVARCMLTGEQRIQHDCGPHCGTCSCTPCDPDIWSGEWPGVAECREFGWYSIWVKPGPGEQYGKWVRASADHPEARADLNRLMTEARWSPELKRWVKP